MDTILFVTGNPGKVEEVRRFLPINIEEIGWFTPDTLPQPLHSQFPHFLELYRNRLPVPASA